jgi:hypothetical protein
MVKYTIAMSTFDDYDGVFFTIQSLRMYHDMTDTEIVVLDNNPRGPHSVDLKNFVNNINSPEVPVSYHEMEGQTGTSATRHKLFELAKGELVIVMDCHILLQKGAMAKLHAFWESADDAMKKNIFAGPLLMDGLNYTMTHFDCVWRAEMLGTWAKAWKKDGQYYITLKDEDNDQQIFVKEIMGEKPVMTLNCIWPGHEKALERMGFTAAGLDGDDEPFEIPGQGLGLFMAAKEHWLGFNPHHKHFGGEECYIHAKYRQAGRKALCLPWMVWNHRFGRPGGPKYPITREGKMRNYVLEFLELGWDLEPIRKHFIDEVKLPAAAWEACVADPINFDPYFGWAPNTAPSNVQAEAVSNMGMWLPMGQTDLMGMAVVTGAKARDLNPHFTVFLEHASNSKSAIEITKRRETTLWIAAGLNQSRCKGCKIEEREACTKEKCPLPRFVSFQAERDTLVSVVGSMCEGSLNYEDIPISSLDDPTEVEIGDGFDLLYIHHKHTFATLSNQLNAFGPSIGKYILLTGTARGANGLKGEDDSLPGLLHAIRGFVRDNPEWFIKSHTENAYGMTVLSRVEEERPEVEIKPWPPTNEKGEVCGVGQEIKKLLAMIGIESTANCACNGEALRLDADGPDLAEQNIESILDWMYTQAVQRGLDKLFFRPAVRLTVQLAIRRARKAIKKKTCW